jgi:ATP-dependent helicase HrpB
LRIAILAAFGDRVGKRRPPGSAEIVLARGGSVTRSDASAVRDAEFLVVLDATSEGRGKAIAHMLSAIEPEWLLELFAARVRERTEIAFDPERERVEEAHQVLFDALVLDESRRGGASDVEVARVLAEAARAHGLATLFDLDPVARMRERAAHAARAATDLPAIDDALVDRALVHACEGRRSFADLRALSLLDFVRAELGAAACARVEQLAPESLRLPGGRVLSIRYEFGKPPSVASYLQDFFGMAAGPRVGGEPLVLELWAPNKRPVQVTRDLAGFWSQHYPALRRQLSRRYPKHAWPEDPLHATPPVRRARG